MPQRDLSCMSNPCLMPGWFSNSKNNFSIVNYLIPLNNFSLAILLSGPLPAGAVNLDQLRRIEHANKYGFPKKINKEIILLSFLSFRSIIILNQKH